jgi:predicted nucleic acid-binding protein
MAKVIFDACVIIGFLDETDSVHDRAEALVERIHANGDMLQIIDLALQEAISVVCRRATQRKQHPPNLTRILRDVREWLEEGLVGFTQSKLEPLFSEVIDVIAQSDGALNYNDAALVVLQQRGLIGVVATFDSNLASYPGFRTIGVDPISRTSNDAKILGNSER